MILIVCVDQEYGMLFNGRRQSRDAAVVERIVQLSAGAKLWMNRYSRGLFPDDISIDVADDYLDQAAYGEYCFVENSDLTSHIDCAEQLVVFQWNRRYPADLYFPMEALDGAWNQVESFDFSGTSHERITMEVYIR